MTQERSSRFRELDLHGTLLAALQHVADGSAGTGQGKSPVVAAGSTPSSLRFKLLHGKIGSIRFGDHYRALAEIEGREATWIWIGHHSEYDRLIR